MDYLKDYIEVKDRIQTFFELYPNGAIHFDYKGEIVLNNETYIWGKAFAYPERDKMAYSTGTAWERVPARGFAKGAEMMTVIQSACRPKSTTVEVSILNSFSWLQNWRPRTRVSNSSRPPRQRALT